MPCLSLFRPLWGYADDSPTAVVDGVRGAIEAVAFDDRYEGIECRPVRSAARPGTQPMLRGVHTEVAVPVVHGLRLHRQHR